MQQFVFKRSRQQDGQRVECREYSGRYRLAWMATQQTIALRTPDKDIARKRLKQVVDVAERERRVIRSLDDLEGLGRGSLEKVLHQFLDDLGAKKRNPDYITTVGRCIRIVAKFGRWQSLEEVQAHGVHPVEERPAGKVGKDLEQLP